MVLRRVLKQLGKPQHRHPTVMALLGHRNTVNSVAFSHNGMSVASSGGGSDFTVRLWAVPTCKETHCFDGHTGIVNAVLFIHDDDNAPQCIASGSDDGSIRVWSMQDYQAEPYVLVISAANSKKDEPDRPILSLGLHPEGNLLAAGMAYRGVTLWDIDRQTYTPTFRCWLQSNDGPVQALSFHPEGKVLVVGTQPGLEVAGKPADIIDSEEALTLWDLTQEAVVATLLKNSEQVNAVCFSPDGSVLLVSMEYEEQGETLLQREKVRGIGSFVGGTTSKGEQIWKRNVDEDGDPVLMSHWHTGRISSIAMEPTGAFCIAACSCGSLQMWDFRNHLQKGCLVDSHGSGIGINGIHFQGDGKCFVTGGDMLHGEGGAVMVWDSQRAKEFAMLKPEGHVSDVKSLSFSNSGELLATAGAIKVNVWTRASGHLRTSLTWAQAGGRKEWYCSSVAFTPDGHLIACTFSAKDQKDNVVIFEVQSGEEKRALAVDCNTPVNAIHFSPNGLVLALGMGDGAVCMWRLVGEDQRTSGHFAAVNAVAFSNDSATLATGSDSSEIKLWDVEKAGIISELKGHTGAVLDLKYAPTDNNLMASSSSSGEVILWDLKLQCIHLPFRRADSISVNSLSFSPDSELLALGFAWKTGGVCEIWNVSQASIIPGGTLKGYHDSCSCVEISPDANVKRNALASASGKEVFTCVTNETAKSDAIAEAKAIDELNTKAAAYVAAADAVAVAAKKAQEELAAASKELKAKTEAALDAAEGDDDKASLEAQQQALLAVQQSRQCAQLALPPYQEEMATKIAKFSQISAELEVASEEQALAITLHKNSVEEMERCQVESTEKNYQASANPTPEREREARDAVERAQKAEETHDQALNAVKAAVADYEQKSEEKAKAFEICSSAMRECETLKQKIIQLSEEEKGLSKLVEACKAKIEMEEKFGPETL